MSGRGQPTNRKGMNLADVLGSVFTLRTGGGWGEGTCVLRKHTVPCNGSLGVPAHQTPDLARPRLKPLFSSH